jgi:anthranilate synthase component 1
LGETTPSREEFDRLDAPLRPVTRRLLADSETPVGVYRKLAGNRPGTFLMETA